MSQTGFLNNLTEDQVNALKQLWLELIPYLSKSLDEYSKSIEKAGYSFWGSIKKAQVTEDSDIDFTDKWTDTMDCLFLFCAYDDPDKILLVLIIFINKNLII